jgi:hypothetical protein
MHDIDTKNQFLELRAKGWSLARIAERLKVAQRTLVDWNRQEHEQIRTPRAIELEALQEKILATREQEPRFCLLSPWSAFSGQHVPRAVRASGRAVPSCTLCSGVGSYTRPIHLRSSQTALSEVRLRRSKMCPAALARLPLRRACQASLALMATNCSTLGSR